MFAVVNENPGAELTPELIQPRQRGEDDEKMEDIRARCNQVVQDSATAEALKPWYRQLCKRPCFHDEYLDAYNRPTCHLVDTDGKGVERIDETGVWVNGVHYQTRLPDLRVGLRGRHQLRPARGLRHDRQLRREAVRALERWDALAARDARARIPEPVHPRFRAGRGPDRERDAQLRGGRHHGRGGRAFTRSSMVYARSR